MRPATTPTDFPIDAPKTAAGKQAAKKHAAWCDQHARAEQVETDFQAAQAELREKDAALRDVLAKRELGQATDEEVTAAEDAFAVAKGAAEAPWQQRAAAAVEASEQRRSEFESFVDANVEELLAEPSLGEEADAVQQAVTEAAEALVASFDRWNKCRVKHLALLHSAQSIDGHAAIPDIPSEKAIRRELGQLLITRGTRRPTVPLPAPDRRHVLERRYALGIESRPESPSRDELAELVQS